MKNIKTLAYDFLLDSGIDKLPITAQEISDAVTRDGTALLPYSKAEQFTADLPEKMRQEVVDGMRNNDGITVVMDKSTIILYSDDLSFGQRVLVIVHELGHQKVGHRRSGVYKSGCGGNRHHEKEADAFALYLLAPPCILQALGGLSAHKISQITGLDDYYAEKALDNIKSDADNTLTRQEKELLDRFRHYIQDNKSDNKQTEQSEKNKPEKSIDFIALVNEINRKVEEEERAKEEKAKKLAMRKKIIYTSFPTAVILILLIIIFVLLFTRTPNTAVVVSVETNSPLPVLTTAHQTVAPTEAPTQDMPDEVKALTEENYSRYVYVTASGTKYHKPDCQYLVNRKYFEITLKEAIERRLTACKTCKP